MSRTFVIGDVHGHIDRLEALFEKAKIAPEDETVQVGDLGQFDRHSHKGDYECYRFARENKIKVLWGNHDYATQRPASSFVGYDPPTDGTLGLVKRLEPRFAYTAHGYLITHAGMHPAYSVGLEGLTLEEVVGALNSADGDDVPVIDDIGRQRGGGAAQGGILWRDDREPLWDGFPQIFGHSRQSQLKKRGQSLCIDVGGITDGNLAGIWLPEFRVVAVGPDASLFETPFVE